MGFWDSLQQLIQLSIMVSENEEDIIYLMKCIQGIHNLHNLQKFALSLKFPYQFRDYSVGWESKVDIINNETLMKITTNYFSAIEESSMTPEYISAATIAYIFSGFQQIQECSLQIQNMTIDLTTIMLLMPSILAMKTLTNLTLTFEENMLTISSIQSIIRNLMTMKLCSLELKLQSSELRGYGGFFEDLDSIPEMELANCNDDKNYPYLFDTLTALKVFIFVRAWKIVSDEEDRDVIFRGIKRFRKLSIIEVRDWPKRSFGKKSWRLLKGITKLKQLTKLRISNSVDLQPATFLNRYLNTDHSSNFYNIYEIS